MVRKKLKQEGRKIEEERFKIERMEILLTLTEDCISWARKYDLSSIDMEDVDTY